MSHIAILHPQCVRVGGAIQMALQSAQALQKQGHTVTLYTFEKSDMCFPDLQQGIDIRVWQTGKNIGFLPLRKLVVLATLAWECRQVDTIIANNPPMQIVAALAKIFIGRIRTIWWHHHIPWYMSPDPTDKRGEIKDNTLDNNKKSFSFLSSLFSLLSLKGWLERAFIVPNIDFMIATSYFIAEKIEQYCGREATVIHPILSTEYQVLNSKTGTETPHEPNAQYVIPSRVPITLFTHGRLEAGKGMDMLIRVFERINKEKIKEKKEGIVSVIPGTQVSSVAEYLHDPESRGITTQSDPITMKGNNNNLDPVFQRDDEIRLIIYGTGSLESELREKGIDVRPFDRENTFPELLSGKHGHVLGVYCSEIDGFGMAPLECQMTGISTVILDRAGARETIVANMSDEPVGYLVDSEEELFRTICHYVQEKTFPKTVSNVNFYHKKDHFTTERLSRDLLSLMRRTGV